MEDRIDTTSSSFNLGRMVLAREAHARNPHACERCHSQRIRCYFDATRLSCMACRSKGVVCHARRKKRMGRRPVVLQSPSGAGMFSIMGLDSGLDENVHTSCPINSWSTSSTRLERDLQEASAESSLLPSAPELYAPMSLTTDDRKLCHILRTREGFFRVHRPFLIGASFADDFQSTLTLLIHHAPGVLPRAYQAVLALTDSDQRPKTNLYMLDLSLGSQTLESFREISTSFLDIKDAAVVLMLGQILLAYNAILWLSATRIVTRGTLLAVQHCYAALRQRPEFDCVTIMPVLIDIVDCLLRREVPVLRPPESTRCVVDRCCGVLYSLLPLLYDLCYRSHAIKTMCPETAHYNAEQPYADIERRIKTWTPTYPPDFFHRYSPSETNTMVASASIYRQTALLVIHRLQFPLGTEDKWGMAIASRILDEVAPLSQTNVDGATGLNLDFPLLVATVELPVRGADVARMFEPLRFCKAQLESNLRFVAHVGRMRDGGFQGSWLDLVDAAYLGDILP